MGDMPVVSLLLRLAARVALMRMLRGGFPRTPPVWRTPGTGRPWSPPPPPNAPVPGAFRVGRALSTAAELSRLGARLLAALVFGAAGATLVAAGSTLVSLGPRPVGVVLLVLAAVCTVLAIVELRAVARLRNGFRQRAAADRLRREVAGL